MSGYYSTASKVTDNPRIKGYNGGVNGPVSQPFQLIAGDIALDFVNTLDSRFSEGGPNDLIGNYSDLIRFLLQGETLSALQFRTLSRAAMEIKQVNSVVIRARDLRESLADVLYQHLEGRVPSSAATEDLQAHFQAAGSQRTLDWHNSAEGSGFTWTWNGLEKDLRLPLWMLAQYAADLLTSSSMQFVRACNSETCRWLFLDTSKNHTRRWCDMKTCGNRVKARRFQARIRLDR